MYILMIILPFIIFNLILFFHEFVRYITFNKFGIKINELSIGIGPQIFKFEKNGFVYSIRAIPIGFSYISDENRIYKIFNKKSNIKKIIILLSSLFMDIISNFFLSVCTSSFQSNICNTRIDGFFQNSTSDSYSKLKIGDEIISINNYKTHIDVDVFFAIMTANENNFTFNVIRNGEFIKVENIIFPTYNYNGKDFVQVDFVLRKKDKDFINIMIYSSTKVGSFIRMFFKGLPKLISRKLSIWNFSKSINVVMQANQIEQKNNFILLIVNLLNLSMTISIILLVFNLIPINHFSTGMILLILIEKITKIKINSKIEELINIISFAFVIFLLFIIIINDILRIIRGL